MNRLDVFMKIILFTDTYLPQMNGVVSCLSSAIKLLSKNHEIVLFAPGNKEHVEFVSKNFKIHWIPSVPFPFYEGYRIASINYNRISNLLAIEKADIVHVHAPVILGLQGVIAAKRKNLPVVITYHTHFPDYIPHLINGRLPNVVEGAGKYTVKKLIKHVFKRANVVTAPTNELVQELRSYGLRNVEYLPNGVDFNRLKPNRSMSLQFRKKYKIPRNKKIILYLGRISFEKKIDQLLKAFKMVQKDEYVLLVVGGGPYLNTFKQMANEMKLNAIFTGFVDAKYLASVYSCSTIFVSPSDSETFGLTFIEAMKLGLPVIGVSRFGPKELIKNNFDGLLVSPNKPDELISAMELLLTSPSLRKKLSKNAKKKAMQYSLEKSITHTLEIYDRLVWGV